MTGNAASPPWPTRPALFFDLDGTLLEIAAQPQQVAVSARLRALLPALPSTAGGAIAVVSGRTLEDIDRILFPQVFAAAGIHGLQRRDAAGRLHAANGIAFPAELRASIEAFAASRPGLLVEDKSVSLAIHYRERPEAEPEVSRFVESLVLPASFTILHGRKVIEIKPNAMDKGRAIRAFMAEPPFCGRTPVFAGDDVTDEAGFAVVNEQDGVSIKIGAGPSQANWRLPDVPAVLDWLEHAPALALT